MPVRILLAAWALKATDLTDVTEACPYNEQNIIMRYQMDVNMLTVIDMFVVIISWCEHIWRQRENIGLHEQMLEDRWDSWVSVFIHWLGKV